MLRLHADKIRNVGNLKRAARRCGIDEPMNKSLEEIRARLKVCKTKCNFFKKHGNKHRRKHLKSRLEQARQRKDEEAEARILSIIQREKDRSYWRRLNFGMKKRKGRSVRLVTEDLGAGVTREHEGQRQVEEVIFSNIQDKRFYAAEHAPICNGSLRGEFGYLANTAAGDKVLDGSYVYAGGFHPATKEILEECARIRNKVPENSVLDYVGARQWQRGWRKAKEKTSSSVSKL